MTEPVVTVERRIAARPETVFSFFADRDRWLSWMGKGGDFAFTPGGAYRTHVAADNHASGHFVEIDPPKRVVFTWGWESGGMPVPPGSSTVEITLEPEGDGTWVRLVHRDLPPEACAPHHEGWVHYLDRLVVLAEGGDPGVDSWSENTHV
ncbi:SRPBCC domain-containing protein [Kitasatospora sp. NBC_00240]|uniref:SRPBCC family protein n=1 Tax=Kitasatospora sp. NBC_00240 TaxID=2903567 RepID=UPI0022560F28|nr:SRPBCC domain-containing protein [Kitasatospora sp. NBC_00240]MCX5209059.1 SRPBCC domain-containing protein [Kitasatospora sp. NBC_00240]